MAAKGRACLMKQFVTDQEALVEVKDVTQRSALLNTAPGAWIEFTHTVTGC
jgi:hypothetical protein